MTDQTTTDAIAFARANERLRQEGETFEELKRQSRQWFMLKLAVGVTSIVALVAILGLCGYVILTPTSFPPSTYWVATVGLLGDILGISTLVWKVILAPEAKAALSPVTE